LHGFSSFKLNHVTGGDILAKDFKRTLNRVHLRDKLSGGIILVQIAGVLVVDFPFIVTDVDSRKVKVGFCRLGQVLDTVKTQHHPVGIKKRTFLNSDDALSALGEQTNPNVKNGVDRLEQFPKCGRRWFFKPVILPDQKSVGNEMIGGGTVGPVRNRARISPPQQNGTERGLFIGQVIDRPRKGLENHYSLTWCWVKFGERINSKRHV